MNHIETATNEFYFVGDLHGDFGTLKYYVKTHDIRDCCIVIAGDIGMGFEKPGYYDSKFKELDKAFVERNVYVFALRGNHDNPAYFDGVYENKSKTFTLIPDYTVLTVVMPEETVNVLCIGGATSIDRTMRAVWNADCEARYRSFKGILSPRTWWTNEAMVYDEEKLKEICDNYPISVVCTHTAPSCAPPFSKEGIYGWSLRDSNLCDDCENERNTCDNVLNYLREHNKGILTDWIYGHFHEHDFVSVDGIAFRMLDMARNGAMDLQRYHIGTDV
ncbi:MAG: metallophosphoesterase [Bacteroidales bacterium]|nr:metallophosphoesterase [Bacteroidales bacterium]